MKKLLFFTPFLIFISCMSIQKIESNSINPNSSLKIGFASCLNQEKKMPIFNRIKTEGFDLFLMMGDNVYGNSKSKDLKELRVAYNKQKQNQFIIYLDDL